MWSSISKDSPTPVPNLPTPSLTPALPNGRRLVVTSCRHRDDELGLNSARWLTGESPFNSSCRPSACEYSAFSTFAHDVTADRRCKPARANLRLLSIATLARDSACACGRFGRPLDRMETHFSVRSVFGHPRRFASRAAEGFIERLPLLRWSG